MTDRHSLSSDSPTEDPRAVIRSTVAARVDTPADLRYLPDYVLDALSAAGFVVVAVTGGKCAQCGGDGVLPVWSRKALGTCAACNGSGRAATGLQHGDQLEEDFMQVWPDGVVPVWRRVGPS